MPALQRFAQAERRATIGAWKLENDKKPHVLTATPKLTKAILSLAARVPFEATKTTGTLYDLSTRFADGSSVLFSFKPYSNDRHRIVEGDPQRHDEVDVRFASTPFLGSNSRASRLLTIMESTDFRIQRANNFRGGRKVVGARNDHESLVPWQELDWDNIDSLCPITAITMADWLLRLEGELDARPTAEFEEIASELYLTA